MFPELHLALKPEVQEKQPNRAERSRHGENPHVLIVGPGPQVRGGINSAGLSPSGHKMISIRSVL
jgi:hypothetical protein